VQFFKARAVHYTHNWTVPYRRGKKITLFNRPQISRHRIRIPRDERLGFTALPIIYRAAYPSDIAAVQMDADGNPVRVGITDLMDVAYCRRHTGDFARFQPTFGADGHHAVIGSAVVLFKFGAPQHGDDAPHGVIMDRRFLPEPPNEAD